MKIKTLILLLIIICAGVIAFLTVRPTQGPRITAIGSVTPDFELFDINKNRIRLSDMKGSVVFVNFWATWCDSCIEEMPSIERLSRILWGNPQFKLVTILYKDDLNRSSLYMKQNGYTFPVYLNPDETAPKIFGITGVPETFILDKKGVLRDKVIGPAEWDSPQAVSSLQTLINEPL